MASALVAGLTLASRLLGVVREALFGYFFSTSELLSAFRIAFQVPNLARRLFGEGALSSAMVPVLTQTLHERGAEDARRFVGNVLASLAGFLFGGVLVAEGIIAIVRWFADDLSLQLTAITLPYAAMICTAAVAGGVLNVRRHFAIPAGAPTLLNLVMIAALIGGAWVFGLRDEPLMQLQCWSVLFAGVLQLLLTLLALNWIGFFPRFGAIWRDPRIRRVLGLMAPMALGLSAVQINTLADSVIAYLFVIVDGERQGTAILGFAQVLYQLPLGVFGISIATAIFPELSNRIATGDRRGFVAVVQRGMRVTLFVAMPSCIGLIFVAEPLVSVIYERGNFDAAQTQRVAPTLVCYSLGMAAYFTQHIVIRAFYSLQDTRTPAKVAGLMVLLDLALNLALVFVMEERGLALATSVCAFIQVAWLLAILHRRIPELSVFALLAGLGRIAVATSAMAAVLFVLTSPRISDLLLGESALRQLACLVTTGAGTYLFVARILGMEELKNLKGTRNAME